jgi:2,4-dienoyl-CoA reductase-like NADH-dependent reductase (Old Yellow Enzyme family)
MAEPPSHLFQPLRLRSVDIRNRLLMTGAQTNMAPAGRPGAQMAAYYAERARGGAGLIVTELTIVHPSGHISERAIRNWDDGAISGLRLLADAVHAHGGRLFAQVGHGGRQGRSWLSERPLLSASALPSPAHGEVPKVATLQEIAELVEAYAEGAARAVAAGMDGVEIHSAYGGYLLSQWLSPATNRRSDEYGGTPRNRLRFVLEVVQAVRASVGDEVPVGIQINGTDGIAGGLTIDDSVAVCQALDATGELDYITVKSGMWTRKELIGPDMQMPHGLFVEAAARIRQAIESCRVFTVGRIVDPRHAERILAEGKADMVGMTRAQMADPELGNKARAGHFDDIRWCIGSNEGCQDSLFRHRHLTCTVNPAVGREQDWGIGTLTRADLPRRVLVVGGGPGGLKAAEVAARRGHEVTLWERESVIGGQVRRFAAVAYRSEYLGLVSHLDTQLAKLRVAVELDKLATPDGVMAFAPDATVLATGSRPGTEGFLHLRPDRHPVGGLDSPHVVTTWKAIANPPSGARVLVVDDGENGWKLVATAIHLAEAGNVTAISTPHASVGTELGPMALGPAIGKLFALGVGFHVYTIVSAIEGSSVQTTHSVTDESGRIGPFDLVVTAFYNRAEDDLAGALAGRIAGVRSIGDCLAPRMVLDAVREGEEVARAL